LFSNKKTQRVDEVDTVIGMGTKFEGKIEATGIVRIDGKFTGEITTQGDIIIGENGNVGGQLNARNMIVAGESHASLNCAGRLQIKTTGKVYGDVEIDNIIIEEKAVFLGHCVMRSAETTEEKEKLNA